MKTKAQITIEEQNKTFLNGLKDIIESTKGVKILAEKHLNSDNPNMFFISSENKDYKSWFMQTGVPISTEDQFISRSYFRTEEFKEFPLIHIAQRLYKDFDLTDCDNIENMTLIFPNLSGFRLGSLYGKADIGMRVEMHNSPETYYVGKNQSHTQFCIQEVPHPNHLEWLKQEKKIDGYFRIENVIEGEKFVKLAGIHPGDAGQLSGCMNGLGYKYFDMKGIYFDGAFGNCTQILADKKDVKRSVD